jgi:putative ABC transport system ATP-binding protein
MQVAIDCQKIVKIFGEKDTAVMALRDVTLQAYGGQMTLLMGPSGCGKTTLLSVITGLLDPTSGQLQVLGQAIDKLSPKAKVQFRRDHLGFVFQSYNLLPALTAQENAAIPLLAQDKPWDEALKKSAILLGELGLGKRLKNYPKSLSGGEQQRVAIARALIHEPSIVVCDEPTSALDAETGRQVMQLLSRMVLSKGKDCCVLVVTHDERIIPFAQRTIRMEDGCVLEN